MNKPPGASLLGALVRVTRFERAISTSQMWRGTNSATPGYSVFAIIPRRRRKSKIFLSVVIPVVRAAFWPGCVPWGNPANARVSRLSGPSLFHWWIASGPLPKQARYQLRYTLLFSFLFSWVYSLGSNALTPYRLVRSHIQSNDLCYNTPLKTAEIYILPNYSNGDSIVYF